VSEDARAPKPRRRLGRRAAIAGAALLGAGGLEYASLRGAFDHRRRVPPTALDRLRASLAASASAPSVVHVGHSTHVLCVGGARLLTDPWFFDPAFGALAHERGPAGDLEALEPLDAVLVSHDHPDHVDLAALDRLSAKSTVAVVVDSGALAARLRARGIANVHVMAAWETLALGRVTVHAVPALHDIHEIGFVVEHASHRVYFAGDTATHPDLPAIAERYAPTFAILPVDGTRLRGGPAVVMDPTDAARAAKLLGVRGAMPSHAEARFTDPLAEHVIVKYAAGARDMFAREMARLAPGAVCRVPEPGERVAL
jgi:L-ascorbate metabolism protein UlaG (beta-lactamase superfamily)